METCLLINFIGYKFKNDWQYFEAKTTDFRFCVQRRINGFMTMCFFFRKTFFGVGKLFKSNFQDALSIEQDRSRLK